MSGFENLLKKFDTGNNEYPESELPPQSRAGGLEAFIQRFGKVSEEYHFYNNEVTIRFNADEHRYYRVADLGNLIPLNGVTNTVGIIDKSFMLTPWAAKMAIQKLLRLIPTEMIDGVVRIKPLTFEEFTVIALEAKSAHKDKLDEAGDIGHMAHKCLEDSINHAMQTDPEKIVRALVNLPADERALNAANGGLAWMLRHNVRWLETESKIYSRTYDYAGTMDGLATCDSCDDKSCCPVPFKEHLSLIDWKSSNHLKIEYLFQTASYKHAKQEEHPELKIEDTWILRLGKSEEEAGKFEPWHMTPDEYEEDFKGFLACLTLTRLVDSVEERMKSQKGTIRAIKKEQKQTAKALAAETAKLQKAIDKAEAKRLKEIEKERIKTEAKAERERIKAESKAAKVMAEAMPVTTAIMKMLAVDVELKPEGVTHRVEVDQTVNLAVLVTNAGSIPAAPTNIQPEEPCTSTLKVAEEQKENQNLPTESDSTPPADTSLKSPTTCTTTMPQPESTISTEAKVIPSVKLSVKEETFVPPFALPME